MVHTIAYKCTKDQVPTKVSGKTREPTLKARERFGVDIKIRCARGGATQPHTPYPQHLEPLSARTRKERH